MEKIIFALIGLYFVVDTCVLIYKRIKYRKIEAVCVRTSDIWVHTDESSSYGKKGVFSYTFNGVEYCEHEKSFVSSKRLKSGDDTKIFINPKNPRSLISEGAMKISFVVNPIAVVIMVIAIII